MANDDNSEQQPRSLRMSRRRSLQLPHQPPDIPIPPSLRQSPYLNSPIFRREIPSAQLPSEEDERWLQDTVPLLITTATEGGSSSSTKGNMSRRGSILQPSRRASKSVNGSKPVTPAGDPAGVSARDTLTRRKTQGQVPTYVTHFLVPPSSPPLYRYSGLTPPLAPSSRPSVYLSQASPQPNVPRIGSSSDEEEKGYFPHVPPIR